MLCLLHFRKNRKNTWNQQRKKTAVFFCKNKFEEKLTVVHPKSLENIRRIAKKNHDFQLQEEIRKKSRTGEAILVHADCLKRFIDK